MASIDEFLRRPRRSEAELEDEMRAVRESAERVDGQHASDEVIRQQREKVMRNEAVAFADVLRRELPEVDSVLDADRQASYVAATLLYLNLRAGFPTVEGGYHACDEIAAEAAEHFAAQGGVIPTSRGEEPITHSVLLEGAGRAQRLLDKFPALVADTGVDRRQACFAAALLTVRLRAGDTDLFTPATRAATQYFTSNLEKA